MLSKLICTAIILAFFVGCNIPAQVRDDIQLIKANSSLIYSFNNEFIKRTKIQNTDEADKKMKLYNINETSYKRIERGVRLLAEYVESTVYLDETQMAITNDIINKIANQLLQKMEMFKDSNPQ